MSLVFLVLLSAIGLAGCFFVMGYMMLPAAEVLGFKRATAWRKRRWKFRAMAATVVWIVAVFLSAGFVPDTDISMAELLLPTGMMICVAPPLVVYGFVPLFHVGLKLTLGQTGIPNVIQTRLNRSD